MSATAPEYRNVSIPRRVYEELDAICAITEKSQTDIVTELLMEYFPHFEDDNGDLTPHMGVYLDGTAEYQRIAAKNEGREIKIEEFPCVVLNAAPGEKQAYYRIWCSRYNNLMKVPANCVRIQ